MSDVLMSHHTFQKQNSKTGGGGGNGCGNGVFVIRINSVSSVGIICYFQPLQLYALIKLGLLDQIVKGRLARFPWAYSIVQEEASTSNQLWFIAGSKIRMTFPSSHLLYQRDRVIIFEYWHVKKLEPMFLGSWLQQVRHCVFPTTVLCDSEPRDKRLRSSIRSNSGMNKISTFQSFLTTCCRDINRSYIPWRAASEASRLGVSVIRFCGKCNNYKDCGT